MSGPCRFAPRMLEVELVPGFKDAQATSSAVSNWAAAAVMPSGRMAKNCRACYFEALPR